MIVDEITGESIINIESLIESELFYTGKSSGRRYYWSKSGERQPVLEQDVPEMLEKRLGKKTCCGTGDNRIFQIAIGGNHA